MLRPLSTTPWPRSEDRQCESGWGSRQELAAGKRVGMLLQHSGEAVELGVQGHSGEPEEQDT
jgi:hypothetical protein